MRRSWSSHSANMWLTAAMLLVTVCCGIVCYRLAERRGLNPSFWAGMGIALGPLAIPFLFLSSKKR
jgi:hypothetical protein